VLHIFLFFSESGDLAKVAVPIYSPIHRGKWLRMWEIRIQHEGLNAYRVVRGVTKEEAALKASLQTAVWDERWTRQQAANQQRQQKLQKAWDLGANREIARTRTEDYQAQISDLETLLIDGIAEAAFTWKNLKDSTAFTDRRPKKPNTPSKPEAPKAEFYAPQLSTIDRILASRRRKKESEAAAKFQAATEIWRNECSIVDLAHQKNLDEHLRAVREWEQARASHDTKKAEQHSQIDMLRQKYQVSDAAAVEFFFTEVLNNSSYPESFPEGNTVSFNQSSGVLIIDFELPNHAAFPAIKEVKYIATRQEFQEVPVSDSWLKRVYDEALYQIALRTLHEVFTADDTGVLKSVVFNGWVHSIDKATGAETHGCILSIQVSREEFLQVNLSQVEPKACFRKLKGVASSKLTELTPVRPILTINREDHRFVEAYSVVETLDDRTNLAAMDWVDFENLIRELFEKEFSKNGGEVKITQASRDGGVDAVAFDPDPIRGGKIIIQAKRYTNVVGVSAVRDLFGTVHNEGANKGILVTTSTYGPDAYEFAKGKPLTLLSGAELLSLLAAHGHRAKIDIREARALAN
jgi:restriction system protein